MLRFVKGSFEHCEDVVEILRLIGLVMFMISVFVFLSRVSSLLSGGVN